MINFERIRTLARNNKIKNSRRSIDDYFYYDKNKDDQLEKDVKNFLESDEYKQMVKRLLS